MSTPIAREIASQSRIVNFKKYRIALSRINRNIVYFIKNDLFADSFINVNFRWHYFYDTIIELLSW